MGQVNVNPPSGPVVTNDGGFGAGMIIGIILLILIVLVLIFYAGPQIFNSGTNTRSDKPSPTTPYTGSVYPSAGPETGDGIRFRSSHGVTSNSPHPPLPKIP